MDYKRLIMERKSVRDFKKETIDEEVLNNIKEYFNKCRRLMPDIEVDIEIIGDDINKKLEGIAGYNGYMIGASNYILIFSNKDDYYLENAGYIGEDIILKARDLDLDSCWVSFGSGQEVKKAIGVKTSKELVSIIALGYEDGKGKMVSIEAISMSDVNVKILKGDNVDKIDLEEIAFDKKWGNHLTLSDIQGRGLLDAFYAASLAPSYLNRQPYRFILDSDTLALLVKRDEYTNIFETKVNAGIVMLNFAGVVSQTMFELEWTMGSPNKDYGLPNDYAAIAYCAV